VLLLIDLDPGKRTEHGASRGLMGSLPPDGEPPERGQLFAYGGVPNEQSTTLPGGLSQTNVHLEVVAASKEVSINMEQAR